jgi:serine/threonine protein kinase
VKTDSGAHEEERGTEPGSVRQEVRTCPVCGTKFFASADCGFCPVCILREAAGSESAPDDAPNFAAGSVESSQEAKPARPVASFENYELILDADGSPIVLGRGAMGITYKALDVDLQYPVTLKVISERYVGDESARRRFLREARAAASVRHPNVASVFHLGRSGEDYFYAMEFVEGETLENLIKRSGRLDVTVALEIASQVAAGLAAVHERNLVHRDIKPTNIMVNLKDGGRVTAKIIDLGLAKTICESPPETAISTLGGFAGTPEFASPEQFAGIGVDIRSDLYSLGVTLWEMLTGHVLFRGSPAEVMYQHQHAPLPLEQLEDVPQQVVVLLEVLLEKDPGQRFQNPAEFLEAIPTITGAIDSQRRITRRELQQILPPGSRGGTRKSLARPGPERISVARLPVTGSDVFGREEDVSFLDAVWADPQVNVVTIVAWAGVGKSTLVNHWLQRMATEHYRSAELVFGWSFYRQSSSGGTSSADEFLDAALVWFGDPDPRIGTAWEKGERLAKLIAHRRTLLVLDGLEPLQNPPGPQEGRVRDPSLQALLRELAAFNTGLCLITTRLPVPDVADHESTSALRRDLEHLSSDAGAKLLRALGVKGHEAELRNASDEFRGHCLALTLLGSYLTDAYNGDVRCRKEVSERLAHDVRQGVHARKVMESYQTWFGEGPELSVLRMLGLFDRPADEKALGALLKPPSIRGLTESLTDLSPTEWRTIRARLRRAKLLAEEDPRNRDHLDTHPLVREYFGEQLRSQRTEAWEECNRRLFNYYQVLAPPLPESFREMEPLFLAAICGCNAGLYHEALHEIYIPRIQRGDVFFAAKVLGARGALLSVLAHFFERGRWGSPVEMGAEGQSLTAEDQLFILMQAGLYLTATRGFAAPEALICYERAESLCVRLNRPVVLFSALRGLWRYSLVTDKLSATMQIAKRVYSLAQEQHDSALMIGAYRALAVTLYYLGDFESAREYAMRGIQIWRSGGVQSPVEEITAPAVSCLIFEALSHWHIGEAARCHATMAEAISLAKELNDMHALAVALWNAGTLAQFERNPAEVERWASDLIELSTRHNFAFFLAGGKVLRGWARSASGDIAEGLAWIEDGIKDWGQPARC